MKKNSAAFYNDKPEYASEILRQAAGMGNDRISIGSVDESVSNIKTYKLLPNFISGHLLVCDSSPRFPAHLGK